MNIERQYIGARYVPILGGAWDRNKSYEALTIVQANNNSYTSKKPVPPGIDITNTEYWVITGNFNGQVEEYRQQVDALKTTVDQVSADMENLETELKTDLKTELDEKISSFDHVLTATRVYVNCVSGNDNNDGSEASPFKTLEPVFAVLNKKRVDTRCYIVSAGVYDIPYSEFCSIALHITSTVPGVTLRFTNTVECAFYNCHCNFGGNRQENALTIESLGESVYFENCVTAINYSILKCTVRFWGNGGSIATSEIYKTVELNYFTGRLASCNSKITDTTSPIFTCARSSVVSMTGSWQMDSREKPAVKGSCFFKCDESVVIIRCTARDNTNNPYNGIVSTASLIIFQKRDYYTAMTTRCTNGNSIEGTPIFDGTNWASV